MNLKKTIACLLVLIYSPVLLSQEIKVDKAFSIAEKQMQGMIKEIENKKQAEGKEKVVPRTAEKGEVVMVHSGDWTSGFFPGMLWFMYEYTGKPEWRKQAEIYTTKLEQEKLNETTHDMGFKIYCSFGNGYRLTKNENYKDIIVQSAKTLSTRFNPKTGVIRSWNHKQWVNPVIIDNMMNLELLFAATRLTGDSSFYKIAVSHADTTIKNHFRKDYSTYHVLDYDPQTGKILKRNTHQGYADESAWARGQAWGIYGYTMCYRETGDKKYLEQARKAADYFLSQTDKIKDHIPYWDFNDPQIPDVPKDASAAAIASSAMFELSEHSGESRYFTKAQEMLESLSSKEYMAQPGTNNFFLLKHSTGHKPANSEIDVPIIYADYYFLEALKRYENYKKAK